jgi:ankyrin repeat protein
MLAAWHGYTAVVELLLKAGAEPNASNRGETPLTLAIMQGQESVVLTLLHHGANPDTMGSDSKSVLMQSAERGDVKMLRALIEAGANVNLRDQGGGTALMWASYRGCIEAVVELLKTQHVQLNLCNQGGYTALMLAQFCQHTAIAELLEAAAENG